jgi:phage tail-like protein
MAMTKDQIKTAYPLPVYNFRVEIDGQTVGFSEVTGLSIAFETITYVESPTAGNGPRKMHMPGKPTPTKLTLKKGLVSGISVATLYSWVNSIQLNQVQKKDIVIRLCDETGNAVVSWKVQNAFPTKLDAPSFTASANDVAIETIELMADGIEMQQH